MATDENHYYYPKYHCRHHNHFLLGTRRILYQVWIQWLVRSQLQHPNLLVLCLVLNFHYSCYYRCWFHKHFFKHRWWKMSLIKIIFLFTIFWKLDSMPCHHWSCNLQIPWVLLLMFLEPTALQSSFKLIEIIKILKMN